MGLFALVEYSLIRELCDKIKRDKQKFAGKLKTRIDYEGTASKKQKTKEIKRLLLSCHKQASKKRKRERRKREQLDKSRKYSSTDNKSKRFNQRDIAESQSESSSSDTFSESEQSSDDSTDQSISKSDESSDESSDQSSAQSSQHSSNSNGKLAESKSDN